MAESSSHNPSSPKITLKEELFTLDKPESPNPFLPADQIEFTFKEIAFTTNNEVSTPKGGIRGDIGINTFRNALWAHYLPHSSGKTGGLDQISNKDATILYYFANGVKSSSAKDKSLSHLSPPTLVVGEMHKEVHQAAGGLTSLGATSEEGAHPHLSSGMSAFNSY
ncbi:hypothetical protein Tco_0660520 [Tanacetum coccineum]